MVMSFLPRTACTPYSTWGGGSGGSGGPPPGGPPTISVQPSNQTVTAPATATFSVGATNPAGLYSLSYLWKVNGTVIAGATSASYTTPATTTGMGGQIYSVVVSNESGSSVASNNVTLTVNPASAPVGPTITQQPATPITKLVGESVTIMVTASGTSPLTYQWQEFITGWLDIPTTSHQYTGVTSNTLTITSLSEGVRSYRCHVSNSVSSVDSNAAVLTVVQPVSNVTVAPADAVVVYYGEQPTVSNNTVLTKKYAESYTATGSLLSATGTYIAGWVGGAVNSYNGASLISLASKVNDKIEHEVWYYNDGGSGAYGGDGQLLARFSSSTVAGWGATTFGTAPTMKVAFSSINLTTGTSATDGSEDPSTLMLEVYEGAVLKGTALKLCSDVTDSSKIPAGYTKISTWKASLALGGAAGPWVYQVASLTNPTGTALRLQLTIVSKAEKFGQGMGVHKVNNITIDEIVVTG